MPRGAAHEILSREQLDLLTPELDNVRAALEWALAGDPALGLELAVSLEEFWVIREPFEGAGWEERLLEAASDAPPHLRASGLRALAGALDIVGEHDRAAPLYQASLELFEQLDDDAEAAYVRFRIGANHVNREEHEVGWPLIEASLEDFRRLEQPAREVQALSFLAWKAGREDDLDRAVELSREAIVLARSVGWLWWLGDQLFNAAELERRRGDPAAAAGHAREALAVASEIGDRMHAVFAAAESASAATAVAAPRLGRPALGRDRARGDARRDRPVVGVPGRVRRPDPA